MDQKQQQPQKKIFACVLKNFCQMEDFALSELKSLLLMYTDNLQEVFKYEIEESEFPKNNYEITTKYFKNYPVIKLNYDNENDLKVIGKRAVGISYIFEYISLCDNYETLFKQINSVKSQYSKYFDNENSKHKIVVEGVNKDFKDLFSQQVADNFEKNITVKGKTSINEAEFSFFFLEVHQDKKTKQDQYLNKINLLNKYEQIQKKQNEEKQNLKEEKEKEESKQENKDNEEKEQQFQQYKDKDWSQLPEELKEQFRQKELKKQSQLTQTKKIKREQKLEKNKKQKEQMDQLIQNLIDNPNIIQEIKQDIENYNGMIQVYFGICKIQQRQTKRQQKFETKYNLKDRAYLGPTSTEVKLAFLMANQGQVDSGSFVYDPFCGSGSLLIPPSHFKSLVFGSDLDSRVIHGHSVGRINDKSAYVAENMDKINNTMPKIMVNFDQYGLQRPEIFRMDCTKTGFKCHQEFDAIICDPPYGIKAMTKKSGKDMKKKDKTNKYENSEEYNEFREKLQENFDKKDEKQLQQMPRFAPIQSTSVKELVQGLYDLGVSVLKKGGRLVFLYPVTKQSLINQGVDIIPQDDRYILRDYTLNDIQGGMQRILVTLVKK